MPFTVGLDTGSHVMCCSSHCQWHSHFSINLQKRITRSINENGKEELLRRNLYRHEETYNSPIRRLWPSPCAAPTTPTHAILPAHDPSQTPCQPERPSPPNNPSAEPRSTPCHHKEPRDSILPREAPRPGSQEGSQEGSHPKQNHGQTPDEDREPDANKRDHHRKRTTPATTGEQKTTRLPMRRCFLWIFTEPPCLLDEWNCRFNYHSVPGDIQISITI